MHKKISNPNKQTSTENSNYDTGSFQFFSLGRGYMPELNKKLQEESEEESVDANKLPGNSELSTLMQLRQRQRELGLMDNQGNLFDPKTKKWINSAFMPIDQREHIQKLFGLDYFELYPEMKNGLRLGASFTRSSLSGT